MNSVSKHENYSPAGSCSPWGVMEALNIQNYLQGSSAGSKMNNRMRGVAEHFVRELGTIFARRLKVPCEMELSAPDGTTATAAGKWQLRALFRVFQRNLWIVLPLELAAELTALLLGRPRSTVLGSPSPDEVTAMSYLFAAILAEETLFSAQRVYLASVLTGEGGLPEEAMGERETVGVRLRILGSEYSAGVSFDRELHLRLHSYARARISHGTPTSPRWTALPILRCHLCLRYLLDSPLQLLELKPGSVLKLAGSEDALRWSLVSVGARAEHPAISLKQVCASDTARLRFRCLAYFSG